jgi:hypothetical protein
VSISRTPSLSPALAVGELANGVSAMRVGGGGGEGGEHSGVNRRQDARGVVVSRV